MSFAKTVCIALFCCAASLCQAEPASSASIETLLEITNAKALVEQMPSMAEPAMRSAIQAEIGEHRLSAEQIAAVEKFHRKFIDIMREELSWDVLKPMFIQIYAETLTQEEIDAQIAFYRTPAGAAMIRKMPLIMMKSQALMNARLGPLVQKLRAAVKDLSEGDAAPAQAR